MAKKLPIDTNYLADVLVRLLNIPSPSGYTNNVVRFLCEELRSLGIGVELTRRGAVRATLKGRQAHPGRAVVSHLDTLGAVVTQLKDNGRLAVLPVGTWSSRFAEGERVTVFTDETSYRGTVLPLKASGHVYNEGIDSQPVSWDQVEVRINERSMTGEDLAALGFRVGDMVAFDARPEVASSGFICSRHLDDKAGVACMLTAARTIVQAGIELPLNCYLLFTIFEEVGTGASAVLHGDVAELVAVDNATPAPGQNSTELDVTFAMMDSTGPFDYHLTRRLLDLAKEYEIPHRRDVFRYYRCDAASAVEAGNDIRTALVCFGVDSSHGYERTHLDGLAHLTQLLMVYVQTGLTFPRDAVDLGPVEGFPEQPM